MFASAVTSRSNLACSTRSRSFPFEMPAQPISGTVLTSKPDRIRFTPAGIDSSKRTSFGMLRFGERDYSPRRFERERRVNILDDPFGRVAVVGVVDHCLDRDTRAADNESARHNVRAAFDIGTLRPVGFHRHTLPSIAEKCSQKISAAFL